MNSRHFKKLERMYLSANINKAFYKTTQIEISEGKAVIQLNVNENHHYALDAMHGSVYFKMLDDAAFFPISSVVDDVFFSLLHLTCTW